MSKIKLAIAAAGAIAAAVTTAAVVWVRPEHHTTALVASGGHFDVCWWRDRSPADGKDWTRMAREGVEFGMDVLELAPKTGHVTVIKAELVNPEGGIRLVKAVFAPNAQFGSGFFGEDYGLPPHLANKVQGLPATLTLVPRPPGVGKEFVEGTWQLAVVVSAPVSATDASATAVKLTYRSGSTERTVNTAGAVRLVRQRCPA